MNKRGVEMSKPRLNRARAIREFCIECMGYQLREVNRCPDQACPLWEWRRGPGGPEPTNLALRRYQRIETLTPRSERVLASKTADSQGFSER